MKKISAVFILLSIITFSSCSKYKNDGCIDEKRIKENAPCNKMLLPVCGCNGKTYGNACVAENAGVLSWKEGKCN
ncbi:MAG: hypothetical protein EOP53_12200 [Sphingobacteriales bacterium]|nr:MAG: hypothetical protein EOP53_12200 [Sphingobacteriales bacterium]